MPSTARRLLSAIAALSTLGTAHGQCSAATYDVACTAPVGDTIASFMPTGSGNQVWYVFELTAGETNTFYGALGT